MRLLPTILTILISFSTACTGPETTGSLSMQEPAVAALWRSYVDTETSARNLQPDCVPRHIPARGARRGMVVFFHGFTACPQQYFDMGERLAGEGFEVYLPLIPGHGREPLYEADRPYKEKYNLSELPSTGTRDEYKTGEARLNDRYEAFVAQMNAIGRASTAPVKVVAGLSGGGGLASDAAIRGNGIWDRVLLYAPYYKNPGPTGPATWIVSGIAPGFRTDWGDQCRRVRSVGRDGYCSVHVGAIRAMTDYGARAAEQMHRVKVPVQYVGVDFDPTADNRTIVRAHETTPDSAMCLYYKGVPHSIINPADDEPTLDGAWVPAMQEDSLRFITDGRWFLTEGQSAERYGLEACRPRL